jgi:hypothetical protein
MSEYNATKDTILSVACGVCLGCMFIGIPDGDGGMWGGWFWKTLGWAIENGWF